MALKKATAPASILDLDPDCLERIFNLIGGRPRDVAPLAAVCTQLRAYAENSFWRDKCLQLASSLCEDLGYNGVNTPPSGWLGLFKLLTYCPGLYPTLKHAVVMDDIEWNGHGWWEYLGHVQRRSAEFRWLTGEEAVASLQLQAAFAKDEFLVSELCYHSLSDDRDIEPTGRGIPAKCFGARGIVKDFAESEIAKAMDVGPPSQGSGKTVVPLVDSVCPYCAKPLFKLDVFCEGACVEGCVCAEGHLLLGVTGQEPAEALGFATRQGSQKGTEIGQSGAAKFMCKHLPKPDKVGTLQEGAEFLQDLDLTRLVQVAGRLTSILTPLEERGYYDRAKDHNSRPPWVPLELYALNQFLRKSEADWTKLFDAILTGQTDPQVEMTAVITRKERREALDAASLHGWFSYRHVRHPESVEEYLQGGDLSAEDVLHLQKTTKRPPILSTW
ncbi:hypothetical protein KFL_002020040 [Klebsormidium nitens]|uniref:F-box domain-containing protein n=1 Tax=Klebsormidium nitens TaxID=105231 RepID=A0A1Y1I5M6_KLENI|nr:hypothetical protein KFL_002020040 [Klebsormidium nitens]|eukprot:GAQ84709.1 hypothetical protein KFL_002020040 [Klebsormidium nitens]